MAGFWDEYQERKRKKEEEEERKREAEAQDKDGEGDSLSFWAGYQRQKRTGESTPLSEPEENEPGELIGKLAERGITVQLPEPEKEKAQKQDDGRLTLAESVAQGKSTSLFTDRLGKTAGAKETQSAAIGKLFDEQHRNETVRNQEWLDSLRSPEEIEKDLEEAKAEQKTSFWDKWIGRLTNAVNAGNVAVPTVGENTQKKKEADERVQALEDELAERKWADYERLRNNEDFEKKSEYKSTANGKETKKNPLGGYDSVGFDDVEYEYVNGNQDAAQILASEKRETGEANGIFGQLVAPKEYEYEQLTQMSDDEKALYNYIHATEGKDAAHEYLEYLRSDLYARQAEKEKDEAAAYAMEHPVMSTIGTVAMSPLRGLGYVGQAADYLTSGTVDQNAPYNRLNYMSSAEREVVTKAVERNWGKPGSFAYGVGISMAEFLLASAASGGNEALSLALMGTGAAADATIEAKERGLSDNQSFWIGTIAGAAEIITEKVSIEKLFSDPGGRPIKYLLQNIFAEGSEEAGSDIINLIADVLISKDKSEWMESMRKYQEQNHMSEKDAFIQVMKDQGLQILYDAAAGAASGGIMALPGTAKGLAQINADRSADIEAARKATQAVKDLGGNKPNVMAGIEQAQQQTTQTEGIPLPTGSESAEAEMAASGEGDTLRFGTDPETRTLTPTVEEAEVNAAVDKAAGDGNLTRATGIRYGVKEKTIREMENLGQITGHRVLFFDGKLANGKTANGFTDKSTGDIYINANAKQPALFTFGHELTHNLEGTDAYNALMNRIKNRAAEQGLDWAQRRADKRSLYERGTGQQISDEYLDEEIAADWIGENLSDEKTIREICRENPSAAKRIRDAVDSFVIRAANAGGVMTSYEQEKFRNVVKLYDRYLERAEQRSRTAENAQEAAQTGETVPEGISTTGGETMQTAGAAEVQGTEYEEPETAEWKSWENAERELSTKWKGVKAGEFTSALEELYSAAEKTAGTTENGMIDLRMLDSRTVEETAMKLADYIADSAVVSEENPDFAEFREARNYLKNTPIYYDPDAVRSEFGDAESYNRWRKRLFGSLRITTDRSKGVPADVIFEEFSDQYPGYVNVTVSNDIERLTELAKAADDMRNAGGKKIEFNPYDQERDSAVIDIAVDLMNELQNRLTGQEPVREWQKKPATARKKPKTANQKTAWAAAKNSQTSGILNETSETETNANETPGQYLMRMQDLFADGQITEEQLVEAEDLAAEMESTGRGIASSTVEREEGPRGKIAETFDRIVGRRYSLAETDENQRKENAKKAVEYFGKTYSWNETGYITQNGDRIDFSGKHEGGRGGQRTVDHRDIIDALGDDYGGDDYSDGMVRFMGEGNIRISPESGGINIGPVEPTAQQYLRLTDFIQKNRGEVIVDLDDAQGRTISSVEYPSGTRSSRVLDSIRDYFRDGTLPEEPEIRYSLTEEEKQRDEEYLDAVSVGDNYHAELLLNDAAEAAGYDTPELYHGTKGFGFTEFDLDRGEQMIFATNKRELAETYSGETSRSSLYEKSTTDFSKLHGEELLEVAKKYLDGYDGFSLMTNEDRREYTDYARKELKAASDMAAKYENVVKWRLNEEKAKILNRLVNALNDTSEAQNDEELDEAWNRWGTAMYDLNITDEGLLNDFASFVSLPRINQYKNMLNDFLYSGDMYAEKEGYSDLYVFDNQLALDLDAETHKGVYELFGKTGRQLVIDAKNSMWNRIQPPEELHLRGLQTTRNIAEAAKAAGYNSVRIKNLRDSGGETGYNEPADVYIFFDANQVKSADIVTYDDEGYVIPLSERFNTEEPDIRYSLVEAKDGTTVAVVDKENIQELMNTEGNSMGAKVRNYLRKKYRNVVLPLGDGGKAYIQKSATNEYTNPAKMVSPDIYDDKMKAAADFADLLRASKYITWAEDTGKHGDAKYGWDYYRTYFAVPDGKNGTRIYQGDISVKKTYTGDRFHDITDIKDITDTQNGQLYLGAAENEYNKKESEADGISVKPSSRVEVGAESARSDYTDSIAQTGTDVNGGEERFSLSEEERIYAEGGTSTRFSLASDDASEKERRLDVNYISAVLDGDEAEERRILKDAAAQRGFTDEAYHGTDAFGFTRIDVSKSDDEMSFFVTADLGTARTYTEKGNVREIGSKSDEAEKEFRKTIAESVDSLADVVAKVGGITKGMARDFFAGIEDSIINHRYKGPDGAAMMHQAIIHEIEEFFYDHIYEPKGRFTYDGDFVEEDSDLAYDEWIDSDDFGKIYEKIGRLEDEAIKYDPNGGIYHVFVNPDGILEVQGNGAPWHHIPYTIGPVSGTGSTRQISQYAKDLGYKGVVFRNIVDDGGRGRDRSRAADVYNLFYPEEQVKSADLVTYDDDGRIILPSKRYDPRENDIRWSLEDEQNQDNLAGLSQKAKSAALRIERQLTSDILQGILRNVNPNSQEFRQFRSEVARPVIEQLLRGESPDVDAVLESTGIDIVGQAAARGAVNDALRRASGELARIRTAVQQSQARQQARDERNAEIDAQIPDNTPQLVELANRVKDAKKKWNSIKARTIMPDEDLEIAHQIATGQMSEEEARARYQYGIEDIVAMAEAEREYLNANAPWEHYTKRLMQQRYEEADRLLENADQAKDKVSGFQYARETPERNLRDVFGEDAPALIDKYIRPVHASEAASTRFKNEYNRRVKDLKLSQKVARGNENSEAAAVQYIGEAEDNIRVLELARNYNAVRDGKTLEEWKSELQAFINANPNLDYEKVRRGIEEFQTIYGELIENMNAVLVENGYMPVNVRRGYFPHFNGGSDGVLATFAHLLGINIDTNASPTAINGLTSMFKPGKPWFGHTMERTGFQTDYDALEGFDGYLGGVSDVIHQTPNIRNLRALATRTRYMMGDEQIRRRIDEINADDSRTEQEKLAAIQDLTDNGRYKLSRFVNWLDEYTNLLANKKSKFDRGVEDLMGRRVYTWMKNIEGRVAANMISGNLGSALTNFIPLNQAGAVLGDQAMIRGAFDTMAGRARGDGFVERSDFLINRRGTDPLLMNTAEKISDFLSKPMNLIDDFTSETIVRAAYNKYLKQGMDEQSAMQAADELAAGLMADRSKGATPTVFGSYNPLMKLFTQFQVEVNNEFSTIFKDIPKGAFRRDKDKKNLVAYTAWTLLRYFIGAYLFNDVYEHFVGRRAALDPVDILNDAVGDLTGKKLNNTWDALIGGEGFIEEVDRAIPSVAMKSLRKNVAEELPFVGGLLGGGRVPISSAFPDFDQLENALWNENWSIDKRLQVGARELGGSLGTYILPPFAGGLGKKFVQTVENTLAGGRYVKDKEGNDQMQYPYFTDTPLETGLTIAQSALLGPTATEGGRAWVEGGFGNQSAKKTALYRELTDEYGESQRTAWDLITSVKGNDAQGAREAIAASGLSDEAQVQAMKALITGTNGAKFEAANEAAGVSAEAWASFWGTLPEFDADGNGSYTQAEVAAALERVEVPLSYGEGAAQGLFGGSTSTRKLTNQEKAALWSAYNPKWKTSNNPFDAGVGERVVSRYNAGDEE